MRTLSLFLSVFCALISADGKSLSDQDIRLTVERLAEGTYDALRLLGSEVEITKTRAVRCGCATLESFDYGHMVVEPMPIGGLGTRCKRMAKNLKPGYHKSCGAVCSDADGSEWAGFCPPGTTLDCAKGCTEQKHSALTNDVAALSKLVQVERAVFESIATRVVEMSVPTIELQKACDCDLKVPIGPIPFGAKIGVHCKKNKQVTHDQPRFDKEVCGNICIAGTSEYFPQKGGGIKRIVHKYDGWDTHYSLHFCPPGWKSDCEKACIRKPLAESMVGRVRDVEAALVHLYAVFPQAIAKPDDQRLRLCGCNLKLENKVSKMMSTTGKHGRHIGWTCTRDTTLTHDYDWQRCGPKCSKDTTNFCPRGFRPSCTKCMPPTAQLVHDEL